MRLCAAWSPLGKHLGCKRASLHHPGPSVGYVKMEYSQENKHETEVSIVTQARGLEDSCPERLQLQLHTPSLFCLFFGLESSADKKTFQRTACPNSHQILNLQHVYMRSGPPRFPDHASFAANAGSALEQSNGPHLGEAEKALLKALAGKAALSHSLTPVQPPAFQEEVKPSPRERRKWGQPEVEHLRGGERRPDFELLQLDLEPDSTSVQQEKLAFSKAESSAGSPASALLRNGALEGERAAVMQRTDFEREAVGAAEEFEQRLDKWGRLAPGLATSGESAERDWVEVKQQLARLELQQGRLMTMLQVGRRTMSLLLWLVL
jgi:hypothetical protein